MSGSRVYSIRLADELADALELRAKQRGVSASDVVRYAIEKHVYQRGGEREIVREILKTRALLRRFIDAQHGPVKTDELLAGAERDVCAALGEEDAG